MAAAIERAVWRNSRTPSAAAEEGAAAEGALGVLVGGGEPSVLLRAHAQRALELSQQICPADLMALALGETGIQQLCTSLVARTWKREAEP